MTHEYWTESASRATLMLKVNGGIPNNLTLDVVIKKLRRSSITFREPVSAKNWEAECCNQLFLNNIQTLPKTKKMLGWPNGHLLNVTAITG